MTEPIQTNDATDEMKQFWAAMNTLGGFLQMMQPERPKGIAIGRCRLYSKIFNICMEHLDQEHNDIKGGGKNDYGNR